MHYSIISFLFAWIFPTKDDRAKFRKFCEDIDSRPKVLAIQKRYSQTVERLKNKEKIKVIFLVNEIAKWKTKSLFDLMQKSDIFEPQIALTIADRQGKLSLEQKKTILNENLAFFKNQNKNVLLAYDLEKNKAISLKSFGADVVFYQQPYSIPKIQDIDTVSKFALTCYVPYYIPSFHNDILDYNMCFHKLLFKFFLLNDELEQNYLELLKKQKIGIKNSAVVGHTMLDEYLNDFIGVDKQYVIYAPHWSITHEKNKNDVNLSTFEKMGNLILNYAMKHPEFNWAFKPHPTLKSALLKIGEWTEAEIDYYYKKWESFAKCCYDSTYIDLFNSSKLLITDCNSFLIEYFVTQKPIVHLVSEHTTMQPYDFTREILNSLYQVKNENEFVKCLDELLIEKNDYKKSQRIDLLKSIDFIGINSAEKIMKILLGTLKEGI